MAAVGVTLAVMALVVEQPVRRAESKLSASGYKKKTRGLDFRYPRVTTPSTFLFDSQ